MEKAKALKVSQSVSEITACRACFAAKKLRREVITFNVHSKLLGVFIRCTSYGWWLNAVIRGKSISNISQILR